MEFWVDKLKESVLGKADTKFFQGLSRKEIVIVCLKNIWNNKYNRRDEASFDSDFTLDKTGKATQEPPYIITRQMGNEDVTLRETGLNNFMKLISE